MLDFQLGDRVAFQPSGGQMVVGTLTRYNKRTVTVITDAGERWNVAPTLLHRVVEAADAGTGTPPTVRKPDR